MIVEVRQATVMLFSTLQEEKCCCYFCDPIVLLKRIITTLQLFLLADRTIHSIGKTGELPEKLVKRISTEPSNKLLTNEHILELFKHFKIMIELPSGDRTVYFMPCLLQPNNSLIYLVWHCRWFFSISPSSLP